MKKYVEDPRFGIITDVDVVVSSDNVCKKGWHSCVRMCGPADTVVDCTGYRRPICLATDTLCDT